MDSILNIIKTETETSVLCSFLDRFENVVIIYDPKGKILWTNKSFEKTYGYTTEEFTESIAKNITETSFNEKINEHFESCITEKTSVEYISEIVTKKRHKLWLQTNLTPILDSNNKIIKIIAIETNINKIKESEGKYIIFFEETVKKKKQISQQKKEITDSIKYAEKIQTSMFPKPESLNEFFEDTFVLFKPKDIISGDFFWIKHYAPKISDSSRSNSKGYLIFTVADCTGHGVPGALMSILGITNLNETYNHFFKNDTIPHANEILNQLRESIIKAMHSSKEELEGKNGMDIALCVFDLQEKYDAKKKQYYYNLQFSGANNPMYIIKKEAKAESLKEKNSIPKQNTIQTELMEVKGDKMPIGYTHYQTSSFTNHNLRVSKGDIIYLFSDGYADQFGGPAGRKFMFNNFKKLLLENQHQSMPLQCEILSQTINEWKGRTDQIDDITVMGIKV